MKHFLTSKIACEQALCLGKKNSKESEGKRGELFPLSSFPLDQRPVHSLLPKRIATSVLACVAIKAGEGRETARRLGREQFLFFSQLRRWCARLDNTAMIRMLHQSPEHNL